jgi:hypothetical protein
LGWNRHLHSRREISRPPTGNSGVRQPELSLDPWRPGTRGGPEEGDPDTRSRACRGQHRGRCRSTPTRGIDLEATYPWLRTSRHWTKPLPINAYVVEHRDGIVLFDTRQERASITDPGYFPGGAT